MVVDGWLFKDRRILCKRQRVLLVIEVDRPSVPFQRSFSGFCSVPRLVTDFSNWLPQLRCRGQNITSAKTWQRVQGFANSMSIEYAICQVAEDILLLDEVSKVRI